MAVFAISYDDQEVLKAYADNEGFPFHLLSDEDSKVIRQYGVLNDQIDEGDAFLYGIPYPGVFICDASGTNVGKYFHDSYKKRESAEMILDVLRGEVVMDESLPHTSADADIPITAFVHGGNGSIRQGVRRKLIVRFELPDDLHIYDTPVPEGMVATEINLNGPPGLIFEEIKAPPTEELTLTSPEVTLNIWSNRVDFEIPFYGVGELVSETRPLDASEATINIDIRYQACNDETCLLSQKTSLTLTLPLEVVDVPALGIHMGHGQREGSFDAAPHMKRLMMRKVKPNPMNLPRFIFRNIRMQIGAMLRQKKE